MPPDTEPTWEANDWWQQEVLLAYDTVRQIEESQELAFIAGVKSNL